MLSPSQAAHAHLLGLEERDVESLDSTHPERNNSSLELTKSSDDFSAVAFGLPDSSKVSAQVFLICSLLHFLGCLLHSGILAMLPMWFVLPDSRGGLQRNTADCALVFSAATVAMFFARSHLGLRVDEVSLIL